MTTIVSEAYAVVFSADGTYVMCATPGQLVDAIDRVVAAGGEPVVFTRKGQSPVNNSITGPVGGSITMAHTIHGGVQMGGRR